MRESKPLKTLRDQKVLITAGPTREYWDPVRFLSNGSSGQMGVALAKEATRLGAKVILIVGPISSDIPKRTKLRVIPVISAQEMDKTVQKNLRGTEVFVGSAAIADFRPSATSRHKIKGKPSSLTLRLVRNPDIIAKVARPGPSRPSLVIGFALETRKVITNAQNKLKHKGLDWIVANKATNIGTPKGAVTLLSRWGKQMNLGHKSKTQLAKQIWNAVLKGARTNG